MPKSSKSSAADFYGNAAAGGLNAGPGTITGILGLGWPGTIPANIPCCFGTGAGIGAGYIGIGMGAGIDIAYGMAAYGIGIC